MRISGESPNRLDLRNLENMANYWCKIKNLAEFCMKCDFFILPSFWFNCLQIEIIHSALKYLQLNFHKNQSFWNWFFFSWKLGKSFCKLLKPWSLNRSRLQSISSNSSEIHVEIRCQLRSLLIISVRCQYSQNKWENLPRLGLVCFSRENQKFAFVSVNVVNNECSCFCLVFLTQADVFLIRRVRLMQSQAGVFIFCSNS